MTSGNPSSTVQGLESELNLPNLQTYTDCNNLPAWHLSQSHVSTLPSLPNDQFDVDNTAPPRSAFPNTDVDDNSILEISRNLDLWTKSVGSDEIESDGVDIQGIDWHTKSAKQNSRRQRKHLLQCREVWRDKLKHECLIQICDESAFFKHHRTWPSQISLIVPEHRNLVAATSRNDVFYQGLISEHQIHHLDAYHGISRTAMDLSSPEMDPFRSTNITTLAASDSVLVGGGFRNGQSQYAIMDLLSDTGTKPTTGDIGTIASSTWLNHIALHKPRSSTTPYATMCCSKGRLYMVDCHSNQVISNHVYNCDSLRCSAVSPDGRLRVLAGDRLDGLIVTNAETGAIEMQTQGTTAALGPLYRPNRMYACAWSDNGWHVATSSSDMNVVVHDARFWGRPVCVVENEASAVYSLKFSPARSGGAPVLVAAEEEDSVSVIDGTMFKRKQVLKFAGACAGVDFTPDGRSLFLGIAEERYGGILEYRRDHVRGGELSEPGFRVPKRRRLLKTWDDDLF